MSSFRTHLTVLEDSAQRYASYPAFRIPALEGDRITEWLPITFSQFYSDVQLSAAYWYSILSHKGIQQRSVVGMWLGGMSYIDVLHIYGIAQAGYIPQLFSLRLPSPEVIYELLGKSNAKALIYDTSYTAIVSNCPLPSYVAVDPRTVEVDSRDLPAVKGPVNSSDVVMIFHTSGSTSGSPKVIPCSYAWLDNIVSKAGHATKPKTDQRRDVTVWMGSMCHIGQTFMLIGALQHGTCTIQPTQIAFSSTELVDMIQTLGLNRLNQFASFLSNHFRTARKNAELLSLLCGLDEVLYSGLSLPRDDEEWAYRNGILLKNLFGSTECGAMLLSIGGRERNAHHLRPIEGTSYGFWPITPDAPQSESGYQNANARLLELVILSESGDCPDASFRHADGHFHTGDLFIEAAPGCYLPRGRDDDWIKSENALRCDTKAIEDNVRATCGDLVAECVVVGNGRPSPAMFVEPLVEGNDERLKRDIIRKTRHFHSRRFIHERITSPDFIVVVPRGTLPRTATKGNIRRKAVEETFKGELDLIYGTSQ